MSVKNSRRFNASKNVWIDHCTFTDGDHPDSKEQVLFGKHIQRHDGLLDIEDSADYLTISYNVFEEHDKTTIIGSGDSDEGEYRITFEGNLWSNLTQRAPRVRFGQVHLVNNYHRGTTDADYPILYSIGMGFASSILSEGNVLISKGRVQRKVPLLVPIKAASLKITTPGLMAHRLKILTW